MKKYFFITVFLLSSIVLGKTNEAENNPSCKVISWNKRTDATLKEITASLEAMPRNRVIQLAWGELEKEDQSNSLALPVLKFLASTDDVAKRRGYFKAMALIITGGSEIDESIAKWPVRPKQKKSPYSLKDLCRLYTDVNV